MTLSVCYSGAPDHVPSSAGEWHLSADWDWGRRLWRQTQPQIHSYTTHTIRHIGR